MDSINSVKGLDNPAPQTLNPAGVLGPPGTVGME